MSVTIFIVLLITSSSLSATAFVLENSVENDNEETDRSVSITATLCTQDGKCRTTGNTNCDAKCRCELSTRYFYDETTGECILSNYDPSLNREEKSDFQERIRMEAERIFNGVLVAALIFICCASLAVIAATFYCCRIGYKDEKLANVVDKMMAKKQKRFSTKNPNAPKKLEPMSESCTVVIADAGVCCA